MVKILIIRWIILNCDRKTFLGMRWEDREKGIFWLYWRHQSSKNCKDNTEGSAALYEYYRAWARHKNNNRRRQPRDLKAAFRNALEKKPELERLKDLDTKERIYWRIKNFPNDQNESCAPTQPPVKKPKGRSNRGRKPSNNLVLNNGEFSVNYGASASTAGEDVAPELRKKSRNLPTKGCGKTKKSLANEEVVSVPYEPPVNLFSESPEVANNQLPLPPIECFKRNYHDDSSWDDSLKKTDSNFSSQPSHFLEASYEKWTPQCFPNSPPQLSTDLMDVSSTEMMDLLNTNQRINYSFQPTPPPEATDILLDSITDEDLMTFGKLFNEGESTILKYSFPFQPDAVPTSSSHLTNIHPVTSLHCSPPDFVSLKKTSNVQSNNCVLDSRTIPQNAFRFDQKQCSYDQVVPPYSEAFQTSKQQAITPEMFVNDCLLYSPPPVTNCGQILEEMCHQQADTGYHSVELFSYNNQTSMDDSGISDMEMEDFLDCADKLLDAIVSQSDRQYH
ncbi:unnamed protein product [Larinioides sclopetarius]|uniref:IRF tryptophan pentad repeat domain-containing protein n=1 Tax=Larinioides sclopetarius TaxID=280406 RepID=A0AAV1ZV40_9ARAC